MVTILGKIKKFFTDLKTHAFNDLANNLTTTARGYALDARQGKTIQDKFNNIGIYQENILTETSTDISSEAAILTLTLSAGTWLIFIGVAGDWPAWYGENGSAIVTQTLLKYCRIESERVGAFSRTLFTTLTEPTVVGIYNCNGETKSYAMGTKIAALRIK